MQLLYPTFLPALEFMRLKAQAQTFFRSSKESFRQGFLIKKTTSAFSGSSSDVRIISRILLLVRFRSTALPNRLGTEMPNIKKDSEVFRTQNPNPFRKNLNPSLKTRLNSEWVRRVERPFLGVISKQQHQTQRLLRPRALRRFRTFLPAVVFILFLKPCVFARFLLLGL